MKKSYSLFFLLIILSSCARNDKNAGAGNSIAIRIKKDVMDSAIDYIMGKFKESNKTVSKDGIVTIVDNQINYVTLVDNQLKYVIDPSNIIVGLIDDDANEDAIITIYSFNGQSQSVPEHLILIKTDGKLMLNRVIESDMKIMGIKDRIITAEISKVAPDSPLDGCKRCKEIVKYQFKNGDLIKK